MGVTCVIYQSVLLHDNVISLNYSLIDNRQVSKSFDAHVIALLFHTCVSEHDRKIYTSKETSPWKKCRYLGGATALGAILCIWLMCVTV